MISRLLSPLFSLRTSSVPVNPSHHTCKLRTRHKERVVFHFKAVPNKSTNKQFFKPNYILYYQMWLEFNSVSENLYVELLLIIFTSKCQDIGYQTDFSYTKSSLKPKKKTCAEYLLACLLLPATVLCLISFMLHCLKHKGCTYTPCIGALFQLFYFMQRKNQTICGCARTLKPKAQVNKETMPL